jgi:hypothetical protein
MVSGIAQGVPRGKESPLVPFQLVAGTGRGVCSTYVAFTETSLLRRK